jgi:hypothetical protein
VRFDALGVENVKDANDYLQEAGAEKLREALALAKPVEEVKQERIAGERQWPTAYEPIDPATIPARRWIYGQHYVRGHVSVLASAGGVGKTSLQIVEALCIGTGKPLLGEAIHEPCKVWIINLEDPLEEMQRRLAAAMLHYGVTAEEIRGPLVPRRRQELEHGVRQSGARRDRGQRRDARLHGGQDQGERHRHGDDRPVGRREPDQRERQRGHERSRRCRP